MDGALELWQGADVHGGLLEVGVLLETLGSHHVPEPVDDPLALGGHLHLRHRVEQQVAAVVRGGGADVVDRPVAEELHRDQPRVGVSQPLAHVREVGDPLAVQDAVVCVRDGLVEGVLADPDGGETEVELADVDGVERGVEGGGPGVHDVRGTDRVVVQAELADVHLRRHHVLDQFV